MGNEVDNLGESVQVAGGTEGQPNPEVSPEPEVQPTSLEADDKLEAALKRKNSGCSRGSWQLYC